MLLLGAAFSYAMYIVSTSRLTTIEQPGVDTFVLFYIILLIIAVSSSLSTLIFSQFEPIEGELWIWLVLLAVFSTLVAFFAYFEALREIPANTASVLLLLQVLVPFTVDYALLDRRYGIWVLAGSVLIIIAMLIVVLIPFLERRSDLRVRSRSI
jgi:drug/metabolite transporter (DMT)-like permease